MRRGILSNEKYFMSILKDAKLIVCGLKVKGHTFEINIFLYMCAVHRYNVDNTISKFAIFYNVEYLSYV